jgi:hypothetical protein
VSGVALILDVSLATIIFLVFCISSAQRITLVLDVALVLDVTSVIGVNLVHRIALVNSAFLAVGVTLALDVDSEISVALALDVDLAADGHDQGFHYWLYLERVVLTELFMLSMLKVAVHGLKLDVSLVTLTHSEKSPKGWRRAQMLTVSWICQYSGSYMVS